MQAVQGKLVKVHFTGQTLDGKVFATSHGQEPLIFTLGGGEVLPGIEKAIVGMCVGEKKRAQITAAEGYGDRNEDLVFEIEKEQLPQDIPTTVGECLEFHYTDGSILLLTIIGMEETRLKVDANHPLAGKSLAFDLELLDVKE